MSTNVVSTTALSVTQRPHVFCVFDHLIKNYKLVTQRSHILKFLIENDKFVLKIRFFSYKFPSKFIKKYNFCWKFCQRPHILKFLIENDKFVLKNKIFLTNFHPNLSRNTIFVENFATKRPPFA